MPIFLFDCVSTAGGRGTGVMHKMTLWLHHTRDSFIVRMCFNHGTALEGINQYAHTAHTHTHTTGTLVHVNTFTSRWQKKGSGAGPVQVCKLGRGPRRAELLLRYRNLFYIFSWLVTGGGPGASRFLKTHRKWHLHWIHSNKNIFFFFLNARFTLAIISTRNVNDPVCNFTTSR